MGGVVADGRQWMTIDQARAVYGVSRRSIYNWIRDGKILPEETRRTPSGSLRILVDPAWGRPPQEPAA